MRKCIIAIIIMMTLPLTARAQRVSVGTNALQWANFTTYNGEIGLAVSRHFSLYSGGRFNDNEYALDKYHEVRQNKQTTFYGGVKYWPWYVNSGLWYGIKGQYQDYSRSCLWRPALEEGQAIGLGLSIGYTIMLTKHINIDFGASIWGGTHSKYALYDCPICLNLRKSEKALFGEPDDVMVSLVFVL